MADAYRSRQPEYLDEPLVLVVGEEELPDRARMLRIPAADVVRGAHEPRRVDLRDDVELTAGQHDGQVHGLRDLLDEALEGAGRDRDERAARAAVVREPDEVEARHVAVAVGEPKEEALVFEGADQPDRRRPRKLGAPGEARGRVAPRLRRGSAEDRDRLLN